MPTAGGIWDRQATARRKARTPKLRSWRMRNFRSLEHQKATARANRDPNFDSFGRRLGLTNRDGQSYSPCPSCERIAMIRWSDRWVCDHCGYADNAEKALV